MLSTVKQYIEKLDDKEFSELYQDYIVNVQHTTVTHQIEVDSHKFKSIDDIEALLSNLNDLTKELIHR